MLDTTRAHPNDTLQYAGYKYDSTGRITYSYVYTQFNPGAFDTSKKTYYTYQGNSRQPDRRVTIQYDLGSLVLSYDTSFYSFNSEGYVVKDSAIIHDPLSTPVYYSTSYTLSGNDVIVVVKSYGPDPNGVGIPSTRIYHQTRFNDNIPAQLDTTGTFRTQYTSAFDPKNNPLYQSDPVHYLVYAPVNYILDNTNKSTINDVQWNQKDIPGGNTLQSHFKYVYVYDKNEQPVTAKEYDIISGSPVYIKYLFVYK
jgi:hypothetical protein